ncbi:MAG: DUF5131 family protein [Hyphomicrobiaceae bacterium]|nr:MAG: DUF5131 family protein [Hyphomicrobiaceae bacterium]
MGANTPIEWCDATWSTVGGCSIESPGCIHCYAQQLAGTRLRKHPLYAGTTDDGKGRPVFNGTMTVAAPEHPTWSWPVRWRGLKEPLLGPGQPSLIFVADMADLFHPDRPAEAIDRVLASIVYSHHIGQLLTKRPAVMRAYFEELRRSARWLMWPHPIFGRSNFDPMVATFDAIVSRLWLGTSVERQAEADRRREDLRALSEMGFTTFVSYEPALGPVDWKGWEFVDQVISGGESGARARPSHPAWHRATREFCHTVGSAYFFKQWGAWAPACDGLGWRLEWSDESTTVITPWGSAMTWQGFHNARMGGDLADGYERSVTMRRVGKETAGRLLDGREHNDLPGERGRPPRTAHVATQRVTEPVA